MTGSEKANIREVYQIVQRLEEKVDDNLAKHDERIRSLENSRSNMNGKMAVLSFVVSGAVSLIADFFRPR